MIPLCDKRLIFVSGKGGVGKTTVAAGLAVALSRIHQRVAVIELGSDLISERLGHSPAGYAGAEVVPGLTAFNITPRQAFEEYATRELHSHRVYKLLLDNRFVHYFLDATPGINALLCLGKILRMLTHEPWDACVVDLPATGHGVGFLEVPRIVTTAIHLGPLRKLGEQLCAMLQDPAMTTVALVTHLEELPVNEALDLARRLTDPLQIAWGPVIANMVAPPVIDPALEAAYQQRAPQWRTDPSMQTALAVTEFLRRREALAAKERARVNAATDQVIDVPRYANDDAAQLIAAVAALLGAIV